MLATTEVCPCWVDGHPNWKQWIVKCVIPYETHCGNTTTIVLKCEACGNLCAMKVDGIIKKEDLE